MRRTTTLVAYTVKRRSAWHRPTSPLPVRLRSAPEGARRPRSLCEQALSTSHVNITTSDRDSFVRCRRSWDFSARTRQGLEPVVPVAPLDLERAVKDALAVYYFPGMWTWDRGVVAPLVFKEFERALQRQRQHYDERADADQQDSKVSKAVLDAELERDLEAGHSLVARYLGWAPDHDFFWPIRVESDFDVHIPDAEHPGQNLGAPDGRPIHYQGRVDMLMADEDDARWILFHRVTSDAFTDVELLRLDETSLGACWGWENDFLVRIAGVVYNELSLHGQPAFRRTVLPRNRAVMTSFGDRLSVLAKQMVAPDVDVHDQPTPEHCAPCAFRSPCLAINEGDDPGAILASSYRPRPEDDWVEGRLGAASWSMSRGAAPQHFEGGRDPDMGSTSETRQER